MIRPLLGFLFAFAIGCARSGAGNQLPLDLEQLTPIERKAVELTMKHALAQGLKWGKPYAIKPLGPGWEGVLGGGEGCFELVYPTPDREVPLLGERALLVNAKTGKVLVAPRD